MRITSIAVLLIAFSTLTGCGLNPTYMAKKNAERAAERAEYDAMVDRINQLTPICVGEKDCNVKWEAAQLWVLKNADFKIQTSTNVIIETYTAPQAHRGLSARVTKEPMGGGKYKIVVGLGCTMADGCNRDLWDAKLDFNRTVGAVVP